MKKPYSEWTIREHATLLRMVGEGFTRREIAQYLGRSHDAVASRLQQRNIYERVKKEAPAPRARITIEKAQVPEFYVAGWRFVEFAGEQCVFERGPA